MNEWNIFTGGPCLVQFLGFGKNLTLQNLYLWILHSQFPRVQILTSDSRKRLPSIVVIQNCAW